MLSVFVYCILSTALCWCVIIWFLAHDLLFHRFLGSGNSIVSLWWAVMFHLLQKVLRSYKMSSVLPLHWYRTCKLLATHFQPLFKCRLFQSCFRYGFVVQTCLVTVMVLRPRIKRSVQCTGRGTTHTLDFIYTEQIVLIKLMKNKSRHSFIHNLSSATYFGFASHLQVEYTIVV